MDITLFLFYFLHRSGALATFLCVTKSKVKRRWLKWNCLLDTFRLSDGAPTIHFFLTPPLVLYFINKLLSA